MPTSSASSTSARAGRGAAACARRARGDRAGARPGVRIALHACLRSGAVAVPVDLRLARDPPLCRGDGGDRRAIATPPPGAPARRTTSTRPAIVVHTSGTTGTPRPVELTYGNWLWSALGSARRARPDPAGALAVHAAAVHVGGLSILLRSAIYATTAIVHERFDTDRVLARSDDDGATIVSLVPTTLARLLDAGLASRPRCAGRCSAARPRPRR